MKANAFFFSLLIGLSTMACQCGDADKKNKEHSQAETNTSFGKLVPDTSIIEKEYGQCELDEENCFTLYFEYLSFSDTGIGPSINALINSFLIGDWKDSVASVQELPELYAAEFNRTRSLGAGAWQVEKVLSMLTQNENYISFYLEELEALGGALPELHGSYLNLRKTDTQIMELNDLLLAPYKKKLETLASEAFKQAKISQLEQGNASEEANRKLESQYLEQHFGIGPSGLHFLVEDQDQPKGIFEFVIPYTVLKQEGLWKTESTIQ